MNLLKNKGSRDLLGKRFPAQGGSAHLFSIFEKQPRFRPVAAAVIPGVGIGLTVEFACATAAGLAGWDDISV